MKFHLWRVGAIGIALICAASVIEQAHGQQPKPIPIKYEFKATITYQRATDRICGRVSCSDETEGPITLLKSFDTESECLATVRLFESMGLTIPTRARPPSITFVSVCTIIPEKKETK